MAEIKVVTSDFVNVLITKSDAENAPPIERRFKKEITIEEFKSKLELVTGGSAATMKLKLHDLKNRFICDLKRDEAMLGSYPVEDGMIIHVVDNFALVKDFVTNSESAEKFELSEEEYNKKSDTVRSFLQRNRLGKYNEEEMAKMREQQQKELEEEAIAVAAAPLGARCEVRVAGRAARRGAVRYAGPLPHAAGLWLGVQFDEPVGVNDGSSKGVRYFECPPKYGSFVKPVHVTVGDFPPEQDDLYEEI